jgi:hypothetical protein
MAVLVRCIVYVHLVVSHSYVSTVSSPRVEVDGVSILSTHRLTARVLDHGACVAYECRIVEVMRRLHTHELPFRVERGAGGHTGGGMSCNLRTSECGTPFHAVTGRA